MTSVQPGSGLFSSLGKFLIPAAKRFFGSDVGRKITSKTLSHGSELLSDLVSGQNVRDAVTKRSKLVGDDILDSIRRSARRFEEPESSHPNFYAPSTSGRSRIVKRKYVSYPRRPARTGKRYKEDLFT